MECFTESCKNEDFEIIFIKIICNSLEKSFREYKKNKLNINDFLILSKLEDNDLDFNYESLFLIEDIGLVIDRVSFPSNYKVSQKVKSIIKNIYYVRWNFCTITFDIDEYMERSTFSECCFTEKISLQKSIPSLNNKPYYENFAFFECTFEKDVTIGWETIGRLEICKGLFLDCVFINSLKLVNVTFNFPFFSNSELYSDIEYDILCVYPIRYIKKIVIEDCIFDSNFTINGIDLDKINIKNYSPNLKNSVFIEDFHIKNSKFNKKFELKYSSVKNIDFDNSNVDGIADFFKSRIYEAVFTKSIFGEFTAFEKVIFGIEGTSKEIIFRYTTFKDFSTFRDSQFLSGLSFSNANMKQEPNFLNAYVSMCGTDRETFRIIKNSFDDVGNKIEANRFFIKEMQSYRKEIYSDAKEDVSFWDKIIYSLNENISSFGQSYIRPTRLLFLSMILYALLLYKHKLFFSENQYLISIDFLCIDKISNLIFELLNDSAENLLPFSRFLVKKDGMEFISLLFYIWFAILIWQIIVAVKRHTQR